LLIDGMGSVLFKEREGERGGAEREDGKRGRGEREERERAREREGGGCGGGRG